jgi:hypothetical protein
MTFFLIALFVISIICVKIPPVLKLFFIFYFIGDIINPIIFLFNEDMYIRSTWGYTGGFNFEFDSLVDSYEKSYFIILLILIFNLIIIYSSNFNYKITAEVTSSKKNKKRNYIYLNIILLLFSILSITFYNLKLGITGVAGEYKYHLSGIVHYLRSYILPLLILFFLHKINKVDYKLYISVLVYAVISGISASSRFVAILPLILMGPYFIQNKKIIRPIFMILTGIVCFILVTSSRDITYSSGDLNFTNTIIYSFVNFKNIDFYYIFDTLTGRLSGAQQLILASYFSGIQNCEDIYSFFLGKPICDNISSVIYQLDLSNTEYGIGLSLIPSIVIHNSSWYSYILPSFLVSIYIFVADLTYKEFKKFNLLGGGYNNYYLFLSTLFLFSGPLKFFYFLNFITLALIILRKSDRNDC